MNKNIILKGVIASPGNIKGEVVIIISDKDIKKVKDGVILVTDFFTPKLKNHAQKVIAIITDQGGITDHPAKFARERKIPCLVSAKNATKILKDGDKIKIEGQNIIIEN